MSLTLFDILTHTRTHTNKLDHPHTLIFAQTPTHHILKHVHTYTAHTHMDTRSHTDTRANSSPHTPAYSQTLSLSFSNLYPCTHTHTPTPTHTHPHTHSHNCDEVGVKRVSSNEKSDTFQFGKQFVVRQHKTEIVVYTCCRNLLSTLPEFFP